MEKRLVGRKGEYFNIFARRFLFGHLTLDLSKNEGLTSDFPYTVRLVFTKETLKKPLFLKNISLEAAYLLGSLFEGRAFSDHP
jgi:hypothetical protein